MKQFNTYILEAINRGIQLALDDFEDNEPNSSLSQHNDVINNVDVIKQKYDLMNEVVDLGLPSGTLWCKYNLGVNSNQLDKAKDWYGDYYAWGELEPYKNDEDDWNNYKFGSEYDLTKYCNNPKYGLNGFTDNLTQLLSEDDVAYIKQKCHSFKFHMPTKEQCEELINYTSNYWVRNYDPNKLVHNQISDGGIKNLNGRIFEGKNGNQLFIPTAGYYVGSNIYSDTFYCYLWSSSISLDNPSKACRLYFDSDNFNYINTRYSSRYTGFPIRPVTNLQN